MQYYSANRIKPDGNYQEKTITETLTPTVRTDGVQDIHGNYATVYLTELPWQGRNLEYTVTIPGKTRVETAPTSTSQFYVDWNRGIIFFDPTIVGAYAITYRGVGAVVNWENISSEVTYAILSGTADFPTTTEMNDAILSATADFPTFAEVNFSILSATADFVSFTGTPIISDDSIEPVRRWSYTEAQMEALPVSVGEAGFEVFCTDWECKALWNGTQWINSTGCGVLF